MSYYVKAGQDEPMSYFRQKGKQKPEWTIASYVNHEK